MVSALTWLRCHSRRRSTKQTARSCCRVRPAPRLKPSTVQVFTLSLCAVDTMVMRNTKEFIGDRICWEQGIIDSHQCGSMVRGAKCYEGHRYGRPSSDPRLTETGNNGWVHGVGLSSGVPYCSLAEANLHETAMKLGKGSGPRSQHHAQVQPRPSSLVNFQWVKPVMVDMSVVPENWPSSRNRVRSTRRRS